MPGPATSDNADADAAAPGAGLPKPADAQPDEAARAADKKRFVARVEVARRNAFNARDRYQEQKKVEADQSIIAGLSRVAKEVTSLGSFEDPGPALDQILEEFRSCAAGAVAALSAGDLAAADANCAQLDALAARAGKLAYDYTEGLIDGAETAKTTVKVVDTGAKIVGGVALTVATGGAAAGVVAAEVVGTATAVSVAGGVAASTAGVATNLALGQKVDWGMFSIDILIQGLTARFGGELTNGIALAVAKRLGPMAATVGGAVIKNAAAQVVMHIDTTLAKQALEVAYQKLVGKDVTMQQVYDECIARLTDPSSLLVIAATSGAQAHVDVKASAASASTKAASAEPPTAEPPIAEPPTAEPLVAKAKAPEAAASQPDSPAPLTNEQLIGDASAALARLKTARASPDGIAPAHLNAAEAALRAITQRQQAAPDPALQKALEAATTAYSDAIHTPMSLDIRPSKASGRVSAANARKVGVESGLEDLAKGRPGFQTHNTSGETRKAVGETGETHQSAHLVPQAVDRAIGASAGKALTVNLPKELHQKIDGDWVPKWKGARDRGEQITGADVLTWVGEAIQKVPNDMLPPEPGAEPGKTTHPLKNTLEWRLSLELKELGIGPDTVIVAAKP